MELSSLLGWIATILFTICYIPQIIKTMKTKTVEGLSFLLLFIQFIANIIALWYASLIQQPPLVIKYIFGLFFLAICLVLYLKVRGSQMKNKKLKI
ncbi:PQ-loop repeat-containing protein [Candidatus Giovannonibacteria bacterium]|nr:PQ-loop repeat-containing protein [Candidatus Giovannonibacteria bacterium]